jgi:hypothetical protein
MTTLAVLGHCVDVCRMSHERMCPPSALALGRIVPPPLKSEPGRVCSADREERGPALKGFSLDFCQLSV